MVKPLSEFEDPPICPLCYPDAIIHGEVVPGLWMTRHPSGGRGILPGGYALFTDHEGWLAHWTREPVEFEHDGWEDALTDLERALTLPASSGHFLYVLCWKAGYEGRGTLESWIMDRMAKLT